MRGFSTAIAGAIWFIVSCDGAAAQSDSAAITSYCSSGGAFGQQFGARRDGGGASWGILSMNAEYVEISAFAPFTRAEVVVTDDTRRAHRITGTATFADERDAQAAYAAAVAAFNQDQRFISQPGGDEQSAAYYADDPNSRSGFKAELSWAERTLMLACADTALSQAAGTEWRANFGLGPMPQAAPALTEDWSAATIAQEQCTPDGAFGQRFGQRISGRSRSGLTEVNRILASPPSYPPFRHLEVTITPRTRLAQNITAGATFADARTATAAHSALVAAYEATGRFVRRSEDRLVSGPAGTAFYSDESTSVGYSVFVALDGREVRIVCSDSALMSQAFNEAFGRIN